MRGIFLSVTALILLSAAAVRSFASAEVSLAGEQDGFYERGDYLVVEDVVVARGKVLTFAPGTTVRFRAMTGMRVEGDLRCVGTAESPIVLTSDNDRAVDTGHARVPRPFDWNGISLADTSARIALSHIVLTYSTYGVQLPRPGAIDSIRAVVFSGNGRQSLSIAGEPIRVVEGEPYSWGPIPLDQVPRRLPSLVSDTAATVPRAATLRIPVRLIMGGLAVTGGTLTAVGFLRARRSYHDYQMVSTEPGDSPETVRLKQQKLEIHEDDAVRFRRVGNVGLLIAMSGAMGFTLTWLF